MQPFTRVLVTGGAGFIGNRLVSRLVAAGTQVAIIDNLFSGMAMPAASAHITPYTSDIRDSAAIETIMENYKPEAIIHLAAVHHIPTCEREPHLAMDVNVMGTQVVLNAAQTHGIKHLVLASSSAVYDWWESALIEDETPTRASDIYSVSKITNEDQARVWAERTGGRVGLARIFNVIGHDDPNGHIIPDILKQLTVSTSKNRTVKLGNTTPKRDYTHADDTADGLFAILHHLDAGKPVEAYNISRGEEFSVADLVAAMAEYFNCTITIEHDPARVRRVDRLHLLGNPEKTRRMLGWQAQIPFAQALHHILSHLAPQATAPRSA